MKDLTKQHNVPETPQLRSKTKLSTYFVKDTELSQLSI